jgi:hypothetical protein
LVVVAQWRFEEGLTAYSCGRSFGFGSHLTLSRTKFPLPIEMVGTPKHEQVKRSDASCQDAQALRSMTMKAAAQSWMP